MDSWKTKYLFPAMGMIPIDRGGGLEERWSRSRRPRRCCGGASCSASSPRAPAAATAACTRATPGAARLALEGRLPDLPGRHRRAPPASSRPTPSCRSCSSRRTITIGRPDHPSATRRATTTTSCLRQIIDEVMYEIREMTGQEYANRYATKKAEDLRDAAGPRARPPPSSPARAGAGHRLTRCEPAAGRDSAGRRAARAAGSLGPAMAEIAIILPDGSARSLPAGATAARPGRVDRPPARQGRGRRRRRRPGGRPRPRRCPTGAKVASSRPTPTRAATSCATRRPTCWPRP